MIYPPNQKPPIWSIDPGIIAYNCQKAGLPHPVLAMPFWEKGGERVLDYSGRGNHGAITGADWVADGLDFVAANSDYVDAGNSATIRPTTGITFVVDMYLNSTPTLGNYMVLGGVWDTAAGKRCWTAYIYNSSGTIYNIFDIDNGDGSYTAKTTAHFIGDLSGQHNHLVFTYNGLASGVKFYINGVSQSISYGNNNGGTINSEDQEMIIGAHETNGTKYRFLNAKIYNSMLYNTALTAAQVKLLYDDPYFMFRVPEELWGYAAAAAGVTIPVFLHHYNQMRQ